MVLLFLVVVSVLILLIKGEKGLLESLRDQGFIDRCRFEIVSLLHKAISSLFYCEQFLSNARCIALKSVGNLATIDSRVHGENLLSRTYEVAIGMAYPELSHVPGVVGEWAHYICPGLLGLVINSVYVLYKEDDLNAAAALSRWEKAASLRLPVWCVLCRQLNRGLPASQFSIFVCVASYDTKSQNVLKPLNRLLKVAHANLDPAWFNHGSATLSNEMLFMLQPCCIQYILLAYTMCTFLPSDLNRSLSAM